MTRTPLLSIAFFALAVASVGCNSGAVDVTAATAGQSFHFTDTGCAVNLTGNTGAGHSAVDRTCPGTLRAPDGGATLHLSTPLVATVRAAPLEDAQFQRPGYQLGQFVVVRYKVGEQQAQCDPLTARGTIIYSAVPSSGGDRLVGRFSDDAALLHCTIDGMPDTATMSLKGSFDVAVPRS